MTTKTKIIIGIVAAVVIGGGIFAYIKLRPKDGGDVQKELTQGEADAIAQKMASLAMLSFGIVGLSAEQQLELKSISERLSLGGYKIDPTSKKAIKK
jgi:hypothetical protein